MKAFFLLFILTALVACQTSPPTKSRPDPSFSNPIRGAYSLAGNFSDYQYFKNSLAQFSQRSFERAKRWALLKEGPDVLSALNSDVLEGGGSAARGPDPTLLDWMPWWMDILKIDVSALVITKSARLEDLGERSCVQIYLDRLQERVEKPSTPEENGPAVPVAEAAHDFTLSELWRSAASTQSSEKDLNAWLAPLQLTPTNASNVRELYFLRSGLKRRIFLVKTAPHQISPVLEIALDPYGARGSFPKAGEANECERFNLGLSLAKSGEAPALCSRFEKSVYTLINESFLESIFRQIENPSEADAKSFYASRCRQLADAHASQWLAQDTKYLVRRLKSYPQIKKRLAYFATMESQEILANAAKNRGR